MSNWTILEQANEAGKGYEYVLENGWSAVVAQNLRDTDFESDGTWGFTIFDSSDNVDYITGVNDTDVYDTAEEAMRAAEYYLSNNS